MDIYGDLDFKEAGQLIAAALKPEDTNQFPDVAAGYALDAIQQGRLAFFNSRVWIAVEFVSGVATWIPITNEINAWIHVQADASDTWTINHNLQSGTPVVSVYDENNYQVIPDEIEPTSQNQVVVHFNTAVTGRAVVIAGDFEGVSRADNPQQHALVHNQTVAANTWVISHGFGYYPLVRVFTQNGASPDELEEILPASVVHNSTAQVTITFSTPRTGVVRLV